MTKRRRRDPERLDGTRDHLPVVRQHFQRVSLEDALIRDAVCHRLAVAIDAVGKISADILRAQAPADWPQLVAMRNLLAHQYADLDREILQNTVDNRLDGVIRLVERLRSVVIGEEWR